MKRTELRRGVTHAQRLYMQALDAANNQTERFHRLERKLGNARLAVRWSQRYGWNPPKIANLEVQVTAAMRKLNRLLDAQISLEGRAMKEK